MNLQYSGEETIPVDKATVWAFINDPELDNLKAYVADSGEGRWTVDEGVRLGVAVPTIALSLFARFASRKDDAFGLRVVAALRNEFGGHAVKKA